MKKCLLLLAAAYYRMCSTDVCCSKQTGGSSTKKTISPHHFFVSGIGQKKTVDAAKICGGAENVKTETANIRKWIARFYYFRHYTPLEARVYCSQ